MYLSWSIYQLCIVSAVAFSLIFWMERPLRKSSLKYFLAAIVAITFLAIDVGKGNQVIDRGKFDSITPARDLPTNAVDKPTREEVEANLIKTLDSKEEI